MKKEQGLHFTHLEIENFKSIKSKTIEIDGKSLIITGHNGAGKSSFIQALLSGINPKQLPPDVITTGERKGHTKVKIAGTIEGTEEEYTLETYFTPANQKGRLVLLNKNGEKVNSPKAVLDSIIGNISFDIMRFLNSKKSDQIKVLKELSGVSKEIDLLDIERKKIYENRTFLGRKIDEQEAVMNNHGMSQDEIDKYSSPIDTTSLTSDLNNISAKITEYNRIKSGVAEFDKFITSLESTNNSNDDKIKGLEEEIQKLRMNTVNNNTLIAEHKEKAKKGKEWLEKNPEPNASDISAKLTEAGDHNFKCEKVKGLVEKQKSLFGDKQDLQKMTSDIESIDDKKVSLIKNSKLPIEGLTFDDDNIYLNKLPFEEGQINTVTLYKVSYQIQKALNPSLRVIFIHSASLFDKKAFEEVIKDAEKDGYQVIAELVGENKELEINFVEYENN